MRRRNAALRPMPLLRSERFSIAALIGFTLGITLFRFWFASRLGPAPDEMYYYRWSEQLALNYGDHPPMVAWMMRLGNVLFSNRAVGIRAVGILLSAGAILAMYAVGREVGLTRSDAAFGAALSTLLIAPASAAVICTPDTFLGMCWMSAVLFLFKLRNEGKPVWGYLFAAACAAGFWSKHAALMVPLLLIAAFGIPRRGTLLVAVRRAAGPALLFLLLTLPYIVAEARSGFPSFSLQARHLSGNLPGAGEGGPFIAAIRILEVLSGQVGLLGVLPAVFAVGYAIRFRDGTARLLTAALFLPVVAAAAAGLFTHPEQNWAALGHPFAAPMSVLFLRRRASERSRRRQRAALTATALLSAVLFAAIHLHALYSMLPLSPERDPAARLHGWEVLTEVSAAVEKTDAAVCDNYGVASALYWYVSERGRVKKAIVSPDRESWPAPGNWLLLSQDGDFGAGELPPVCREVESLGAFPLLRADGKRWDTVRAAVGTGCAAPAE